MGQQWWAAASPRNTLLPTVLSLLLQPTDHLLTVAWLPCRSLRTGDWEGAVALCCSENTEISLCLGKGRWGVPCCGLCSVQPDLHVTSYRNSEMSHLHRALRTHAHQQIGLPVASIGEMQNVVWLWYSPVGQNRTPHHGRDAAASSIPGGAAPFKHGVGGYWDLRGAGAAVRVQEGSNCVCQQVTQQGRGLWHRGCACLVSLGDEWVPLRAWWYPSAELGHSTLLLLLTHLEPSSRSLKASK